MIRYLVRAHRCPLERRISVRTCGPLYRQWKQTKSWYRRAPEDGIEVDVPFVLTRRDDGGGAETRRPLAVLLHGAPGNYRDFSENLIPRLFAGGVDVLAPSFPDLRFSIQNKFFWHSIEERTALLRDFLRQLGITRIDALVAHSAATFLSLRILLERQEPVPTVKSLVLLAPNSHITPSVLKPRWLKSWMAESYRKEILRPLVKAIVLSSCYLGLTPVKPDVENVMLSLITYSKSGYQEGDKLLEAVARMKLPTLVAISRNDRLLSYSLFVEVCAVLGASEADMWHFDGDGRMLRPGKLDSWLKVLNFEKGSHYPFVKHPDVCADEILQLLQRRPPSS
ncbi:hypothetical protein HPB47_015587 [Ixodes persulcatus]|uniref:Uncharacterized protein n=1 Tax=Ixodes persulcatus TaxID=34615 RepID=A0AC60QT18_IXOPE|nr:hypothetical protein HPB47_015587 [Ixodes persulcatus]